MQNSRIEWCDATWNPVTGCLHGCEYCYARRISKRFGVRLPDRSGYPETHSGLHCLEKRIEGNPYPYLFEPTFLPFRLEEPGRKAKTQNIFVCSMADLFGSWVPDKWIAQVFDACDRAPQHRYLFLTKNVQRYTGYGVPCRKNLWYGVSVTREADMRLLGQLPMQANTFVSLEPLLEDLHPERYDAELQRLGWIILGAETGKRTGKVVPRREWVESIVKQARAAGVPVFMKDSLVPVVGASNLLRAFPWDRPKTPACDVQRKARDRSWT